MRYRNRPRNRYERRRAQRNAGGASRRRPLTWGLAALLVVAIVIAVARALP